MPRLTLRGSIKNYKMMKKRGRKVILYLLTHIYAAWEMLVKKMEKMNLSEAEKEMIKNDIRHKEAELNRKMYGYGCFKSNVLM